MFSPISSREISLPWVGRHGSSPYGRGLLTRGVPLYREGLLCGLFALVHVPYTSLLASLRERLPRACSPELLNCYYWYPSVTKPQTPDSVITYIECEGMVDIA